ncbi:MAG: DUF1624 domain-containing protein [Oscillospiraceae bacterium]|nr:DUF1624 domain-containing protein [Oscillospiraceae bacterium]
MPLKLLEKTSERTEQPLKKKERIELLDLLRGAAMIFVMLYHLLYDLVYYKNINIPFWGTDGFEWIHQFFLWILFAVSGICTAFSRDIVKRGAVIYLMGSCLTIASNIFSADAVFVFGVLSFFGMMMMLSGIIRPITDKLPWQLLFTLCILLYIIFFDFSREHGTLHLIFADVKLNLPRDREYLYPLGIRHSGFSSMDYFPLIPNGFVYLAGVALSKPFKERTLPKFFFVRTKTAVLNFIGRHSLAFYIIHQPLFLLLTNIF